jgi:S-adenosylmethionine decarboxylase
VKSLPAEKLHVNPKADSLSGLHILANLSSEKSTLLKDFHLAKIFIDSLIQEFNLTKVGEVYHDFPGGGFTAVVCLTESHLSIHTWPENNYLTFDIFLSNYLKDNSRITELCYGKVVKFFEAKIVFEKIINR